MLNDHVPSEDVQHNTEKILEVAIRSFPNSLVIKSLINDIVLLNQQNCDLIQELCQDLDQLCEISIQHSKRKKSKVNIDVFEGSRYFSYDTK